MSEPEYIPTQEDIAAMIKWLRFNIPDQATPEKAVFLLNQQKVNRERLNELYPEMVEEMLKDYEEQ